MAKTRIAIHGAAGRMGRRLIALGGADEELEIAAALEAPGHPALGQDAGWLAGVGQLGAPLSDRLEAGADVLIDFSTPSGAEAALAMCVERRTPLVLATTGLSEQQRERAVRAAEAIPIVWAPNMSLAVNLTMQLVEQAARAMSDLPGGVDVEIIERHHRFKKDAPSGTALRLGRIIAGVMGQTRHRHGREGQTGERPRGEIGYHAVRMGDHPGEHAIIFGMLGESLELIVRATSRDCYAQGALAAAKWIVRQEPGMYGMGDVLGLGGAGGASRTVGSP